MCYLLASLDIRPNVIEADSLAQARRVLDSRHIDLVMLDLRVNGFLQPAKLDGLREEFPGTPMVVLSAERDPTVIHRCMEHGAAGFITKHASHGELLAAIRLIVAGGIYLPREAALTRGVAGADARHPSSEAALLAQLSSRQREVLGYLLQGKPNKTISTEMDISPNTVKSHLSAIFRTLGARNRTEAVYVLNQAGVSPESVDGERRRRYG